MLSQPPSINAAARKTLFARQAEQARAVSIFYAAVIAGPAEGCFDPLLRADAEEKAAFSATLAGTFVLQLRFVYEAFVGLRLCFFHA